MSTRGCVAIGTAVGWEGGRFVKKYGAALPEEVWELLCRPDGVATFERLLVEHPAGFFEFPGECFCHMTEERAQALLYAHGVNRAACALDPVGAERVGVEVACVLEVATRMLHLFSLDEDHLVRVASVPIDGPTPDWDSMALPR